MLLFHVPFRLGAVSPTSGLVPDGRYRSPYKYSGKPQDSMFLFTYLSNQHRVTFSTKVIDDYYSLNVTSNKVLPSTSYYATAYPGDPPPLTHDDLSLSGQPLLNLPICPPNLRYLIDNIEMRLTVANICELPSSIASATFSTCPERDRRHSHLAVRALSKQYPRRLASKQRTVNLTGIISCNCVSE